MFHSEFEFQSSAKPYGDSGHDCQLSSAREVSFPSKGKAGRISEDLRAGWSIDSLSPRYVLRIILLIARTLDFPDSCPSHFT